MKKTILLMAVMMSLCVYSQKQWTLDDCISYAIQNNLTLKMNKLQQQTAQENVKQSKAALLPTLTASTSHGVGYSPWEMDGIDKSFYNGSYGVNAQWTVWNGGQNTNTVKLNKLAEEQAGLEVDEITNSIQEQIAKIYVQILYTTEAIEVNRQSLETCKKNEERGKQMVEVGKMSKADLAQLSAQRIAGEYSIVESETQLAKYKQQLRQILDIRSDADFDIAIPATTDQQALADIPTLASVYDAAMAQRPEIKAALLDVESSKLQMKIAKGGKMPTISMTGSIGSSTNTLSSMTWGNQIKQNVDLNAGVGISIPLIDGRKAKTAVNKAKIAQENAYVALENEEKNLYETIEIYWLEAVNNQQKFRSATASVESEQASYNLLQEQFNLGLKNIVELMSGKDKLLTAQQNMLQSKYMTILDLQLLKFYQGETLKI